MLRGSSSQGQGHVVNGHSASTGTTTGGGGSYSGLHMHNGELICNALIDIAIRVAGIRPFLIQRMLQLLICSHYSQDSGGGGGGGGVSVTMMHVSNSGIYIYI